MLASQFNYEGKKLVATSYEYIFYANIHAGVEIIAAQQEHNQMTHIHM
jgi:hypothetical protein